MVGDWPSPSDIDILCKKAAGLFIYAATVIKFVASKYHIPTKRLSHILSLPQSTTHEGRSGIDLLYTQVLEQAFCDVDLGEQELYSCFRSVVGVVLLVYNLLPIMALSVLLGGSNISTVLRYLHSVLLFPNDKAEPIQIFHKSFPDFLMDPGRCKDERFFINPSVHHQKTLLSCLNLMKGRLRRNICNLDNYVVLSKVKDISAHREKYIGDALEYACMFWARHLVETPSGSDDAEVHRAIEDFFTTQLLFWIEVLIVRNLLY